jgi:hypothetical protein
MWLVVVSTKTKISKKKSLEFTTLWYDLLWGSLVIVKPLEMKADFQHPKLNLWW